MHITPASHGVPPVFVQDGILLDEINAKALKAEAGTKLKRYIVADVKCIVNTGRHSGQQIG